jgi:CheY-like chemotaxis protein
MASPVKCPRCSAAITATPDEMGFIVCPSCQAKLRTKTASVVKAQGSPPPPPVPLAAVPPDVDSVLAHLDAPPSPSATLPPGTPLKKLPRPATLESVLAELQAVRETQKEILALLKKGPARGAVGPTPMPSSFGDPEGDEPSPQEQPVAPVRARRRKTVVLIDDDAADRQAALAALEKAEVPTRALPDGNGGLAAIAAEKPDVIVMELGIGGPMAGKDVINMIKATMEWVDLPIVLYTRIPIESQKEARTIHGADEFVPKGPGAPEALVAKVITVFRKG